MTPNRPGLAAALLIGAGALLILEAAIVRLLGDRIGHGQILVFRAGAQLVLASVWILWLGGAKALATDRLQAHVLRGLLSIPTWVFYYASFRYLELGLATTLTFSAQIFVIVLAGPLLGETLTPQRVTCALLGFVGVAVAAEAWNLSTFDYDVFYGLAAALFAAGIILMSRSLSQTETLAQIMFYVSCIALLAALPIAWLTWRPLSSDDAALLVVLGVIGSAAFVLMTAAYRFGEASALAPFPYFRLLFAALVGYTFFGEAIAPSMLVGAALIVVPSFYLTVHEARARRAAMRK